MKVSQQTRIQVIDIVDRLLVSASRGDIAQGMDLIAEDFSGFVSGRSDRVLNRDSFARWLRESGRDNMPSDLSEMDVRAEGTIAWVTAVLVISNGSGGDLKQMRGKLTLILRGTGHTWVITHLNLYLPMAE
jgi:ketosteroid isomerase-like protein